VVTARQYPDLVFLHLVDQTMLMIDAPGPTTTQFVPQRLRLAEARKGLSLRLSDQANDAVCLRPFLFHPRGKILKSRNVKLQAFQQRPRKTDPLRAGPLAIGAASSFRF
jgi:hypothetical protein